MDLIVPQPTADARLEAVADLEGMASYIRQRREELDARVRSGAPGLAVARAHSDIVDAVVRRMFAIACTRAGGSGPESVPLCIVATGGYGRRELCPHSDIDITFIPHRDGDPTVDRIVKEMFTLVMRVFIDAAGIEVGYAYRLLEDCDALDHQTISGLMDARLVAGSDRLFIQFEHEFWLHFNSAEFIFTKLEERRRQQVEAGGTARVVEPNLKSGVGGLRDLQAAVWVAQARKALTAARVRGERWMEVLRKVGGISAEEADALADAREFLFRMRNAMHTLTGAERDSLVVTRQEEIAPLLGYEAAADGVAAPPPVVTMMRDYYRHAAALHRICSDVMRGAEHSRLFMGIGLDCKRRQLTPANPVLASDDPIWMLWACELAQRFDLDFSDALERAVVELVQTRPVIQDEIRAAEILTRILASPRGAYPVLQRMADLGVLDWVLPEVGAILDLIPYDPSHDFTVGQHTLHVVRALDALRTAEGPEETRDFRNLIAEMPHPAELYLAALLHDAGKVSDERPHSETGAEIAVDVCRRLRWSERATANVSFLVRHHLLMAETSRLRDLTLEETIRDFAAVVDDPDRLHMLYLLTYADTSAVGQGVWTQVKARFLRDLHRRADRALAAAHDEDHGEPDLNRTRRRLLKDLAVENLPREEVAEHLEGMPAPYILNTSQEEIALHIGFARRVRAGQPVVAFHDERDATFTEVTVCALDDPEPGLLSKIAGVLYAADLVVHSAQVFTRVARGERVAIDTLFVDYRGRQLTSGKRRELSTVLGEVLTGKTTVADYLSKRRKPAQIGGPVERVSVSNQVSEQFTVIEVTSADPQSTLYRVSGALSALGWDIHSARLSHFRGRLVASFYVKGARELGEPIARRKLLELMPLS